MSISALGRILGGDERPLLGGNVVDVYVGHDGYLGLLVGSSRVLLVRHGRHASVAH